MENSKIGATEFENELTQEPAIFLERLRILLGAARERVWCIIQEKKFNGFADAQNLVKAYDHLNKILSIFEAYQLPLPEKKEEEIDAKGSKQAVLPVW